MALARSLLSEMLGGRRYYDPFDGLLNWSEPDYMVTPVVRIHYVSEPGSVKRRNTGARSGVSQVINEPDKFRVHLDVRHFQPNEIEVKTVDNSVVIHGKHEERADEHGFVSREFTRRYVLPEGVEADKVVSSLNAEGILSIEAPRKRPEKVAGNERVVPIKVQHAPAVNSAEQAQQEQMEQ